MKIRNIVLASYLLAASLVPLPASAAAVCENGICKETFEFTGSYQTWQVPSGVTKISFKVYGASGGRGGAGGEVRGELTSLPGTLYFFVGGQGSEGSYVPGGFNGGGSTTGSRGNEGSGGGASDIRFGLPLNERVVVAGGGGGAGGYAGAAGGAGGGLIAEAGGSGQGAGGGGGTQSSGGLAGAGNGGAMGTNGAFGVGGNGGSSWNAGGGGGGGGWYGGGGGGPDDNSCCADGGGGGGGSSYARSDITLNVQHQAGVNTGNGRIEISYEIPITVVSFTGEQIDSALARFELVMSADITGLTIDDFVISQISCQISKLDVTGTTAVLSLTSCEHGELQVTLKNGAVGAAPPSDMSVTIDFDKQAPTFAWGEVEPAIATANLTVSFSISEVLLSPDFLDLGNCSAEIAEDQLLLTECSEGENTITLRANQLIDQWGNAGPTEPASFYFLVDLTVPDGVWTEVEITQSENFRYQTILQISEVTNFDPASVTFTSDEICTSGFEETEGGWLYYADCPFASGNWTLPALSFSDAVGNLGPTEERMALFSNPIPPTPEPEQPQEVPAESPQQSPIGDPQPQPEQTPSSSSGSTPDQSSQETSPVDESEPLPVVVDQPSVEPILEVPPVFVIENPSLLDPWPQQSDAEVVAESFADASKEELPSEQIVEPQVVEELDVKPSQETTQPILTEENKPSSEPPYLLFALAGAVVIVGLLGIRFIGR